MRPYETPGLTISSFSNSGFSKNRANTINDPIFKKISVFRRLPSGWDFGIGEATLMHVAEKTKEIYLAIISKYPEGLRFNVTPQTNGGIVLIISTNDNFINIHVNSDSSINLIWEKGIGFDFDVVREVENVNLPYILRTVFNLYQANFAWNLSEPSPYSNMILMQEDFKVIPLVSIKEEYPSLNYNVRSRQVTLYAGT